MMNGRHWWQRRSGRIVAEFDALCGVIVVCILTIPALATTIIPVPFTNTVINIGDIPPWIMAGVVLVTWWEARTARKLALGIGTKIDGMLVDRDKAKVAEGEKKGAVVAATLAEGQRQGRENERGRAPAPTDVAPEVKRPLPVADDRTASASERVANATERAADASSRVADASEKNK